MDRNQPTRKDTENITQRPTVHLEDHNTALLFRKELIEFAKTKFPSFDPEDLAHDTLLKFFMKGHELKNLDALLPYLRTTMLRTAIDGHRRSKRVEFANSCWFRMSQRSTLRPDEIVELKTELELVRRFLKIQENRTLSYMLCGVDEAKIAELLGVSERSVRMYRLRIKQVVLQHLT